MPLFEKLQSTSDMNEKVKFGHEAQRLMHLRVEVYFNRQNLDIDPPPSKNIDLKIPGTAFAYKIKNKVTDPDSGGAVLAFGNWQTAKWDAGNGWFHFAFVHKEGTPYVENAEVLLYGAQDRIEELLHGVAWSKVNDAMTR